MSNAPKYVILTTEKKSAFNREHGKNTFYGYKKFICQRYALLQQYNFEVLIRPNELWLFWPDGVIEV